MAPKVPKVAGLKRVRLTVKSPVADARVPLELGNGPVPSELGDADVPRELSDSPVPLQLSSDIVASALVPVKEEEAVDPPTQQRMGRGNAKKREGMNPLEVSRMLGMLKKMKLKDRACVFAYRILNIYV